MNNIIIPPSIIFVSINAKFFDYTHNYLRCNNSFLSKFLDEHPYAYLDIDNGENSVYYIDMYHNENEIKDYFQYIAFNGYEIAGKSK